MLFAAAERGRANVRRLDLTTGRLHDVTAGDQEVMSFSASADGSRIVALISTATEIGDLFVIDANGGTRPVPRSRGG